MHEPSDGIAEEVERQLQLLLAAAAIAARRATAARGRAIEQAARESEQATRAVTARIDAERLLATERLRPVFDGGWWKTATPQDVADLWQEANSWRDLRQEVETPTFFDRAAGRIREELRGRAGLDPTQVIALAAIQELEHEDQATVAHPAAEVQTSRPEPTGRHAFDDPQLRARLDAAGVPEPAIQARTVADIGQAREAAEAAQTPVAAAAAPRPASARSSGRDHRRER